MSPTLSVTLATMDDALKALQALHNMGFDEVTLSSNTLSITQVETPNTVGSVPLLPDQNKVLILLMEHEKLSKTDYGKYFGDIAAINRKLTPVLGVKPIFSDGDYYTLNQQAKDKLKILLGIK